MTQFYDRRTMERLHQHLARADLELRDAQHVLAPDSDEEAETDIAHAVSAARLGVTTALARVRTQLGVPEPRESPTETAEEPEREESRSAARATQGPSDALGGPGSGTARGSWWARIFRR
jgi:hypothetical protein